MSNEEQPKRKPRLSCLELIITIVIIGVLVATVPPAIKRAHEHSWVKFDCAKNMHQLYLALHTYHDAYQSLPPAFTVDAEGRPLHSWRVLVLPYLEAEKLYQNIRLDESWDSEYNQQFHDQMPSVFACPATALKKGETTYMALTGPETCFPGAGCRAWDDPALDRETSVLLVEAAIGTCWMAPVDVSVEAMPHVSNHHSGGGHIIMADGAVIYVKADEVLSAKREMQNN